MSKKNKFDNVFESTEGVDVNQPAETQADISPIENQFPVPELAEQKNRSTRIIHVNAQFSDEIVEIGYVFLANGEQNVVSVSNGKLHMMQGRQYYIPVNKEIDSDEYNIKVHSDAADRFDVRFVKDNFAAIVPTRHNTILKTGEKLCILTPLT